ncbi:MAG: LPS export ABC transporter periplasmic protein LptC [Gammaproteobacteria bacterium]|nr:MAG: LPS export ABC transporter periplasmic protein LptC [Gammaproteobacteria bacterium]
MQLFAKGERKRGFVLVILISSLALLFFAGEEKKPLPQTITSSADIYFEDFTTRITDINGNDKYHMNGKTLLHYKDRKSSEFRRAQITLFSSDNPPWLISSDKGIIHDDNSLIELQEKVVATQTDKDDKITAITADALLYPETGILKSAEAVSVASNYHQTTGIGLNIDTKNRIVNINSDVKGTHNVSP